MPAPIVSQPLAAASFAAVSASSHDTPSLLATLSIIRQRCGRRSLRSPSAWQKRRARSVDSLPGRFTGRPWRLTLSRGTRRPAISARQ
jgi:hypothetical protein